MRPTNTSNLVEIGSQGTLPHSGEMKGFVTFVLPFFRFLILPKGRNSGPTHTFNSSNDVFCFDHVPFWGLEP